MPLFFIASVFFMKPEKYSNLMEFVSNRWYTLYRPFIIFFVLVMSIAKLFNEEQVSWLQYAANTIKWGGYALWFIPVLAFSEAINYLLGWSCNNQKRLFLLIVFSAFGYLAFLYDLPPYWNIYFVPAAALFYGLGSLLRNWLFSIDMNFSVFKILMMALTFVVIGSLCLLMPAKPEWFINKLVSPLSYPLAIISSVGIFMFCIAFSKIQDVRLSWIKTILIYVGQNTFVILAFHQVTLQFFAFIGIQSGSMIRIFMCITMVLIIEFVNRFCPQLLGQKYHHSLPNGFDKTN